MHIYKSIQLLLMLLLLILLVLLQYHNNYSQFTLHLTWGIWWPLFVAGLIFVPTFWCKICPLKSIFSIKLSCPGKDTFKLKQKYIQLFPWSFLAVTLTLFHHIILEFHISSNSYKSAYFFIFVLLYTYVIVLIFSPRQFCSKFCPVAGFIQGYSRLKRTHFSSNNTLQNYSKSVLQSNKTKLIDLAIFNSILYYIVHAEFYDHFYSKKFALIKFSALPSLFVPSIISASTLFLLILVISILVRSLLNVKVSLVFLLFAFSFSSLPLTISKHVAVTADTLTYSANKIYTSLKPRNSRVPSCLPGTQDSVQKQKKCRLKCKTKILSEHWYYLILFMFSLILFISFFRKMLFSIGISPNKTNTLTIVFSIINLIVFII